MQVEKAMEINRRWGDRPCEHKELIPEYYLGASTGDYVCKKCGASGWGKDWVKKEKEAIEKKLKEEG